MHLSPTFLNTGTTDKTFRQSPKQDSFRHILKSSAIMSESSGSQFFKTTIGMQRGPDAIEKSSLVISFSTNLVVTEIYCKFRSILEGETGLNIKVRTCVFSKQFCFIIYRRQHHLE